MANELIRGRQAAAVLTNGSGAGVVAGDTVIVDPTDPTVFDTNTTAGAFGLWVGIAQETIADGDSGRVLFFGYAPLVTLSAAAAAGNLIRTNNAVKLSEPVDGVMAGVFGIPLELSATPSALIMGWPQIGAWNLIEETVLGAPAASVTFSSIPGTYRALVLMTQAASSQAAELDRVDARFNGDAGNNYDRVFGAFHGTNTQDSGESRAINYAPICTCEAANSRANSFGFEVTWILGYATTDREKRGLSIMNMHVGNAGGAADMIMRAYQFNWRSVAAITSILLYPQTGPNFIATSRFTLYGVV